MDKRARPGNTFPMNRLHKYTWRWYTVALGLLVLDRWTKHLASTQLEYGVQVKITSFFNFTLVHNPGAAFSFLSDAGGWQHWLFGGIAAIVSVVLVVWIARLREGSLILAAGLAFILSGAIGNLLDRLRFGYVVDFIQVHYQHWYWPAFNVADSAITVGAVLLVFDSFRRPSSGKSTSSSDFDAAGDVDIELNSGLGTSLKSEENNERN